MQQQARSDIQSFLINRNRVTLQHSEDFIDPDKKENWHIGPENMLATQQALMAIVGVDENPKRVDVPSELKYVEINNYARMGAWIKNALIQRLKMPQDFAEKLSLLMERSMIRADKYTDEDWQIYFAHRQHTSKDDKSWMVSAQEMNQILDFIMDGIRINNSYSVPYCAGLSDDGKSIYFDKGIAKNPDGTLARLPLQVEDVKGSMPLVDYIVLHERVEGAMMEQSYLEQLRKGRREIAFEYPLEMTSGDQINYVKSHISYSLSSIGQLVLAYDVVASTKEANEALPSFEEQAKQQGVLSYVLAHQIAERLERAAIYASGYGEVWETQYNKPVQVDIERLRVAYTDAAENAEPMEKTPPGLYILPYMSYKDPEEAYLFRHVFQAKPGIAAQLDALSKPRFATTVENVAQSLAATVLSPPHAVTNTEDNTRSLPAPTF